MVSKIKSAKTRIIFIIILVLSMVYIGLIKTSFYQTTASILIKDIDDQTQVSSLLGVFTGQTDNSTQDAYVIQEYLQSYELYDKLDKKFNLTEYYQSNELDFLQRLYNFNEYEDYVELYNKQLNIVYDDVSGITQVSFLHTNNKVAKEIVSFLILEAENRLNEYNRDSVSKQLDFISKESVNQKLVLEESIRKLESYQDVENIINPNIQVEANETILSTLKVQLLEKEATLKKISKYLTNKSFEVVDLKRDINELKYTITKVKKEQSGTDKKTLNKSLFAYEKLKAEVDLNTELYKQSLLQLQASKVELNKNSKLLQVLVKPNLAESYSEPRRARELITTILVLSLIYGVLNMIIAIVKDHRE